MTDVDAYRRCMKALCARGDESMYDAMQRVLQGGEGCPVIAEHLRALSPTLTLDETWAVVYGAAYQVN